MTLTVTSRNKSDKIKALNEHVADRYSVTLGLEKAKEFIDGVMILQGAQESRREAELNQAQNELRRFGVSFCGPDKASNISARNAGYK